MGFLDTLRGFGSSNTSSSGDAGNNGSAGNMNFQNNNQQNNNQQRQEHQGNIGADGNPVKTEPNDQNASQGQEPKDPMAAFSKMFDNTSNTESAPGFTLDPTQLDSVVAGQDFMQGIDPELIERATTGDAKALMEVMKRVGANSYKNALAHNSRLTEGFVTAREGFHSKGFEGKVRSALTDSELVGSVNSKNPAVRQQLKTIAESLQKQHPDATPQEIVALSKEYVKQLNSTVNPSQEPQAARGTERNPVDWDDWFSKT